MRQLCCFPHVYTSLLLQVRNGLWFCTESATKKKKNPNQPNQPLVLSSVLCFEFVFLNSQSLGWVFFFPVSFFFLYWLGKDWGLICLYNLSAQHVKPLKKKRHSLNICPINGYWKDQRFMADKGGSGSCLLTGKTLFIRSVWLIQKVCSWISFMAKEENQYQMLN